MFWKKKSAQRSGQQKRLNTGEIPESFSIQAVVLSDTGNLRPNNEDAALFLRFSNKMKKGMEECLLIVADGMGGHQAGEIASRLAVETISREYGKHLEVMCVEKRLLKAFVLANERIYKKAVSDSRFYGMGTTCTALAIVGNAVYYAHVGDSRAYLLKKGSLTRLTIDHTYVQQLLLRGTITAEQAVAHPDRNVLTNAMGTHLNLRVDTGRCSFSLEAADRLLLCSDGLYDYLNESELAEILNRSQPLHLMADYLVAEAKKRGGHDNITVVLAAQHDAREQTSLKETADVILPIIQQHD